jgi:hypothetical protein
MKKVFAIMAIAALFAACNNSTDSAADAAKKVADSTRVADSIANVAKMEQQKMDEAKMAADSLKAKMAADSAAKMKDSKMQKK